MISPPDFATRVAILRKRAALDHIPVGDDAVLELIADRITDNVRALEGALIRVVASHSLTGRRIDVELATSVLDEMYPDSPPQPALTIDDIQRVVAAHFGISVAELVSVAADQPHRAGPARWRSTWPASSPRRRFRRSDAAFGGRNHATVLHACKRVSQRIKSEPGFDTELADLARSDRHAAQATGPVDTLACRLSSNNFLARCGNSRSSPQLLFGL